MIRRANIALHGFLKFLNPNCKLSRNFLQPIKWQCKGEARGLKDLFKHSEKSAYLWNLVFSLWISSVCVTHRCVFIYRRDTTAPWTPPIIFSQESSSCNVTGFTQKIGFNSQENLISCEKFLATSAKKTDSFHVDDYVCSESIPNILSVLRFLRFWSKQVWHFGGVAPLVAHCSVRATHFLSPSELVSPIRFLSWVILYNKK